MEDKWASRGLIVLSVVLALVCGSFIGSTSCARAANGEGIIYLEFVMDSSLSMKSTAGKGLNRMQIAKSVFEELVKELPNQDNLHVALRVYGANLVSQPCQDSVLVQPFGPVSQVREAIIEQVRKLEPSGMTPIGYSLEQAAKDFPKEQEARKVIVLITDGAESCGLKPCEISKRLQQAGIIMEPYVVGFGISDQESSSVACIGKYYAASDTESLKKALQGIMQEVVTPTMLHLQAMAGGENVTDQVEFRILDAMGKVVKEERGRQAELALVLSPGVYTVQGSLNLKEQTLTKKGEARLSEGDNKSLVLDFGTLMGQLEIVAKSGNQDITDQVHVLVTQGGREVATVWSSAPKVASLRAGSYDVTLSLPNQPQSSQTKTIWVPADEKARLQFALDELSATLSVKAIYGNEDITKFVTFTLVRDGQNEMVLPRVEGGVTAQAAPGVVDLVAKFAGLFSEEKTISEIALEPGQTKQVTVDFSDVLGRLRLSIVSGENDVTETAQGRVAQPIRKELPYEAPYRTALLPIGKYLVDATSAESIGVNTSEVGIKAGINNDIIMKLVEPGLIEVQAFVGTSPVSPKDLEVHVYDDQGWIGQMYAKNDTSVLRVAPGVYQVEGRYFQGANQEQKVKDVAVESGKTTAVKLSFVGEGRVVLAVTLNDQSYKPDNVWVYHNGDYFAFLEPATDHTMQGDLPEGIYDFWVLGQHQDNLGEAWVRDVEVLPGQTKHVDFSFGGASKIRLRTTLDGKPYDTHVVWVYHEGDYYAFLEQQGPGLVEAELPTGVYDLCILGEYEDNLGEQWIYDVEIQSGRVTELTYSLGESALLEVQLTLGGRPYEPGFLELWKDGDYYVSFDEVRLGLYQARVLQGHYELRVAPNDDELDDEEVQEIVVNKSKVTIQWDF